MRLPLIWQKLGMFPTLPLLMAAGCDQIDSGHQCHIHAPSNTWTSNHVTMDVTAPLCPVNVDYPGYPIYLSSRTRAPENMPDGNLGTRMLDYTLDPITDLLGLFWPIGSGLKEALTTGYYAAGRDGIPLAPDPTRPIQDRGFAQFNVSAAYGFGIASGFALLPYTIGNPPVSTVKATLSFWTEPQVGAPTFVRVVPQVSDQPTPARVLWSFDGRPVLDSAVSRDPRYPVYFTNRILPAKVWTRGIHTWRVDVTYGTWPNEKTASTTWKQTFY